MLWSLALTCIMLAIWLQTCHSGCFTACMSAGRTYGQIKHTSTSGGHTVGSNWYQKIWWAFSEIAKSQWTMVVHIAVEKNCDVCLCTLQLISQLGCQWKGKRREFLSQQKFNHPEKIYANPGGNSLESPTFSGAAPWLLSVVTVALDSWCWALSSPCGIFGRLRWIDGEVTAPKNSNGWRRMIIFPLDEWAPGFFGGLTVRFCWGEYSYKQFLKKQSCCKMLQNFTKK